MSHYIGKPLLTRIMPEMLRCVKLPAMSLNLPGNESWQCSLLLRANCDLCTELCESQVESNRGDLFWYILFLRISPILPNWFINISAPQVNIPLSTFAIGTLVGLIPNNYIYCTMGLTISDAVTLDRGGVKTFLMMLVLGSLALLPTLFKKKLAAIEESKFAASLAGSESSFTTVSSS